MSNFPTERHWWRIYTYANCPDFNLTEGTGHDSSVLDLIKQALDLQVCEDCEATELWLAKIGAADLVMTWIIQDLTDEGPYHDWMVTRGLKRRTPDGEYEYVS